MKSIHSQVIKQIFLLFSIVLLTALLIWQLWYFLPGFLGAITLYICLRKWHFYLVDQKHWKNILSTWVIIITSFIVLVLPFLGVVLLLSPKVTYAVNHPDMFVDIFEKGRALLEQHFPDFKISEQDIQQYISQITSILTKTMTGTAHILVNVIVAFFLLYFLLIKGKDLEKGIDKYMPLKQSNQDSLWKETKTMVISNAVGIPLLTICQCIVAILGYWIFNVEQYVFWGIITGVASIIPIVGCMVVYIPLVIYMYASGDTGNAIGVLLFSVIITSNIDNVLRFTLLKKIGDVHPIITVFGVILGLQIFGIMGLIFGPLLIAYFILLFKVYYREFYSNKTAPPAIDIQPEESH